VHTRILEQSVLVVVIGIEFQSTRFSLNGTSRT